jgi:DNA polymerase
MNNAERAHIQDALMQCQNCSLHLGRTKTVPGIGTGENGLLICGEGPGAEEDKQGIPFVGPAGQLLDRILSKAGIPREKTFITNIVKCRPPGNRTPNPEEVNGCMEYLITEIAYIRPSVILCLGAVAANALIHSDFKITKERGEVSEFWELGYPIPILATYHPAYILRKTGEDEIRVKKEVWSDFHMAMNLMHTKSDISGLYFQ